MKRAPAPTLSEQSAKLQQRGETLDARIKAIDAELAQCKEQLKRTKGPAQARIKQRAVHLLKQRHMYEQQRDQTFNQQCNVDQASFVCDTLKDSMDQFTVMRDSAKAMKKQFGKVDVSKIERMQDEMANLFDDMEEIQDIMSRTYSTPMEMDEDELLSELDMIGDEMSLGTVDSSYLDAKPIEEDEIVTREPIPSNSGSGAVRQRVGV